MRASHDLHLGEHPRERLGVATTGHRRRLGALDSGDGEDLVEDDVDVRPASYAVRNSS